MPTQYLSLLKNIFNKLLTRVEYACIVVCVAGRTPHTKTKYGPVEQRSARHPVTVEVAGSNPVRVAEISWPRSFKYARTTIG